MSQLTIRQRREGDVVILDLDGRLTLGESNIQFRSCIGDLLEAGCTKMLANLGEVDYLDSSGVGELVSAYARAERRGAAFKLLNLSSRVQGLLQTTKLLTVFEIFDDERAALRSFAGGQDAISTSR